MGGEASPGPVLRHGETPLDRALERDCRERGIYGGFVGTATTAMRLARRQPACDQLANFCDLRFSEGFDGPLAVAGDQWLGGVPVHLRQVGIVGVFGMGEEGI